MSQTAGRALGVCDPWLGSNGYAGIKALRRTGWAVHVVAEWEYVPVRWETPLLRAVGRVIRRSSVREFNRALLASAERLQPHFLLVFKGMFVHQHTLRTLRRRGVHTYCFFPDVSFRAHGPYLPKALPEYDWVFTTKRFGLDDMKDQLGVTRASLLLHAFDPDLHRPRVLGADDLLKYRCDVSFIGTWSPKKERMLAELIDLRPRLHLRIWGEQWFKATSISLRNAIVGHGLEGDEYVKAICASSINLAILSERRAGASSGDLITSRTFHIPACKAFMLHERSDDVTAILPEDSAIGCFSDSHELALSVDRFLAAPDQRERMSQYAYDIVAKSHSWDDRIKTILERYETDQPIARSALPRY